MIKTHEPVKIYELQGPVRVVACGASYATPETLAPGQCVVLDADYQRLTQAARDAGRALQALSDVQNGCPLPKYEADWQRAMQWTQEALAAMEKLT